MLAKGHAKLLFNEGCPRGLKTHNFHTYFACRKDNLGTISERILQQRQNLYQSLKANGTPGSWDHILNQTGMFSFTGLTRKSDLII